MLVYLFLLCCRRFIPDNGNRLVASNRSLSRQLAGLLYRNYSGSYASHVVFSFELFYPYFYYLMPFPSFYLFYVFYHIPILTHLLFPFLFTFFFHNSVFKARFSTPHYVIEEIERDISLFKPKVIRFVDETFCLYL